MSHLPEHECLCEEMKEEVWDEEEMWDELREMKEEVRGEEVRDVKGWRRR